MRGSKRRLRYPGRVRRIERLINLIAALLDSSRPMTADDIRESIAGYDQANFEAFRRAFERDKQDLREMGIPIEVVSAPGDLGDAPDAYTIPKERYYLPDLDLEPDEVAALSVAGGAVLGASDQALSGLMKISMDVAPGSGGGPRVAWGADLAAEQPLLGPVYGALLDRVPVTFSYRSFEGSESERTVEPYAVVHRRGNWYLVGRDAGRGEIRSFRLSRFTSPKIERGKTNYDIPGDFDASDHIAGHAFEIGPDEQEEAVVRFSDRLGWWVEQNFPENSRAANQDGSIDLKVPVANVDAFVSWVIGFGTDARIVSPAGAQQALLDHLGSYGAAT